MKSVETVVELDDPYCIDSFTSVVCSGPNVLRYTLIIYMMLLCVGLVARFAPVGAT